MIETCSSEHSTTSTYSFTFTGKHNNDQLHQQVTHLTIDQSIETIPPHSFHGPGIRNVQNIELPEGLQIIGEAAFSTGWALSHVRIPCSVHEIQKDAFAHCVLRLRTIELPKHPIAIGDSAFQGCARLRNVAIAYDDVPGNVHKQLGTGIFKGCHDLSKIVSDPEVLLEALTTRFDGLPIHRACYYHSYDQEHVALESLQSALIDAEREAPSTQDFLGMTPIHILALSKIHRKDLYRACINQNPNDLMVKDKWGAIPIHYACENNAPIEIIQLLLNQHSKLFPNKTLRWDHFLMSNAAAFFSSAPLETIKLVLEYQLANFPAEELDWARLLHDSNCFAPIHVFRYLVQWRLADRIQKLGWQPWADEIEHDILTLPERVLKTAPWIQEDDDDDCCLTGIDMVDQIEEKLEDFERRNASFLLEMACWKAKLSGDTPINDTERSNSRFCSGADCIIPNVLSFLPKHIPEFSL